jgi:hypothetical protein
MLGGRMLGGRMLGGPDADFLCRPATTLCASPRTMKLLPAQACVLALLIASSPAAFARAAFPPQWASKQDARIAPEPNDLAVGNRFGDAVALDGVHLVVGAHWHDPVGGAPNDGAAWIWRRTPSGWNQEIKLTPSVMSGGRFGYAVAASGDTVAVGAPYETFNGVAGPGAVYVYTRASGAWSLEARLTALDFGQLDRFGASLALEGDTLAIGAPYDDEPGTWDRGSAYVFVRSQGVWTQQAKLLARDGASNDSFGVSIALSGARVLVGAEAADVPGALNRGAAYVFERLGSSWSQSAKLEPRDGAANDNFAASVALDGDTAVVGAPRHDGAGSNAGAAYVYVENAGAWSLQSKLTDVGAIFADNFGTAVDLEGDRLVVGLPISFIPGVAAGAVQFFTRSAGVWTGHFDMIGSATDGADYLGTSVAISGDFVAGGAPGAETTPGGPNVGEAYVFKLGPPPLIELYCTAKTNSLGCLPRMSWSGTPSASNPSTFELRCTQVLNWKSGLLFYGGAAAALPFEGGFLCAAPPLRRTPVQNSYGSYPPSADCSGLYSLDLNAWIQSGADPSLVAGAHVWTQHWMRDPQALSQTGLSDSVHFQIAP